MRIERRDRINAPANDAFLVLRDKLTEFVRFLPNIDRIEVESRQAEGDEIATVNRWYAKTEIPEIAKKFVKPEYLSWLDTAKWKISDHSVKYEITSPVVKGLLKVSGHNRLLKKSETESELHVVCDVEIYPEKVPGVPRFMASLAKRPIEEIVKKALEPNLTRLADGLNRYFSAG
jgi:hypothetical protein